MEDQDKPKQDMDQLVAKIIIKGKIQLLSGMSIGSGNKDFGIGGIDKAIIRIPTTNMPYIPGSSYKGKLRFLLESSRAEYYYQVVSVRQGNNTIQIPTGKPGSTITNKTGTLFGVSASSVNSRSSRLIVRDAVLCNPEIFDNTDLWYSELKTEVVIDRLNGKATPRTFERVPAGALFDLHLILNVVKGDSYDYKILLDELFFGMTLLEDDYLGGSGSRGYGSIKHHIESVEYRSTDSYSSFSVKTDEGAQPSVAPIITIPENLRSTLVGGA